MNNQTLKQIAEQIRAKFTLMKSYAQACGKVVTSSNDNDALKLRVEQLEKELSIAVAGLKAVREGLTACTVAKERAEAELSELRKDRRQLDWLERMIKSGWTG